MPKSIQPTKDQIILATFKLAAQNNALLKYFVDMLVEMRFELTEVSANVQPTVPPHLKGYMDGIYAQVDVTKANTKKEILVTILKGGESLSMKESYEWAFENDPSFDISGLGL